MLFNLIYVARAHWKSYQILRVSGWFPPLEDSNFLPLKNAQSWKCNFFAISSTRFFLYTGCFFKMTTWRYHLNRWSEWDELRATNRGVLSWTCDKVWCETDNRFGDSACLKVFEFLGCSCWISWPILIKLGSWHFLGKAHLPTENQDWGCVIAKVDPSKISWQWPKSADFFYILYTGVRK